MSVIQYITYKSNFACNMFSVTMLDLVAVVSGGYNTVKRPFQQEMYYCSL